MSCIQGFQKFPLSLPSKLIKGNAPELPELPEPLEPPEPPAPLAILIKNIIKNKTLVTIIFKTYHNFV